MRIRWTVPAAAFALSMGLTGLSSFAQDAKPTDRPVPPAAKPAPKLVAKPEAKPAAKPVGKPDEKGAPVSSKTQHETPDGLLNGQEKWDLRMLFDAWKMTRVDFDKNTRVVRCFLQADESLDAKQKAAFLRRSTLLRVLLCDAEGEVLASTRLIWAQSNDPNIDIIKIDLNACRDALDEQAFKPDVVRSVVISDR